MQSQPPSTKTQSLDRLKYRHDALQKIKNELSHHEIQGSQAGLQQNSNSTSPFEYQIANGKQPLSRLSKPYNGLRHESATDFPQHLLNFTQPQQAQPQQQINGQKVLATLPQYSSQMKLIHKPSIERDLQPPYMRCSPALDSGAGSSRSDSPHSHSQHLVNSRPTSAGQYSPSPSNFSDGPPVPPPRNSAPAGTPTPPHFYWRAQNTTPTTTIPKVTTQTTRGTSPVSGQTVAQSTSSAMSAHRQTPVIPPNGTNAQQQLSQKIKAINLYQSGGNSGEPPPPYPINTGGPPLPPSYTSSIQNRQSPTQSDFRKSPSSGIYSATSAGSPSPIPVPNNSAIVQPQPYTSGGYQTKTQQPIIMQSVKSTQVKKPVLQTAIAPQTPANISPSPVHQHLPPQYSPSPPQTTSPQTPPSTPPIITNSINGGSIAPIKPTSDPPSYAKTIQARKQQQQQVTTRQLPPPPPYNATQATTDSSAPTTKPRTTTPVTGTTTSTPTVTTNGQTQNGEQQGTSNNCKKIKHQSPIPERKQVSKEKEEERKEFRIRHYSPQAFKFYMEQHIENVLKSVKQRAFRKTQLEKEMVKINLAPQAQVEMRKMLNQKESNYIRLKRAKMDKSMFVQIKPIGVGAFGEVSLVRKIDTTNHLYAMKTLRKADVLKRNQVAHVKAERDILAEADNEWVVKLYYSFQDRDNLYFVMDYIPGGDLMSLLIKKGIFEEPLAIFYIAELTCAVESVHKMGFIHRDIKPDNILIDRDGHIKLTDFGLCTGFRWTHNSKYYQEIGDHARQDSMEPWEDYGEKKPTVLERRRNRDRDRVLAHSLVGTPNYIAPEVLQRSGYTQMCDWWSVGVILYEMLVGQPPFLADTPLETQQKVINWEKTLHIPPLPKLAPESTDLIRRLCSSADKRLGKNADEVKAHEFFKGVDFDDMRKQKAPFIPKIEHPTDTSNFDPVDPEKLRTSNDSNSDFNDTIPFHGFLEFTFRRFFDDRREGEIQDDPPGPVYV